VGKDKQQGIQMVTEKNFMVHAGEVGTRLDKWLCGKLGKFSRRQIKTLLDNGRVLVNGRRVVIAGWELEEDDRVEVRISPGFGDRATTEDIGKEAETSEPERRLPHRRKSSGEKSGIAASLDRHLERKKRKPVRAAETATARRRPAREAPAAEKKRGERGRDRLKIYHEDKDLLVVEKPAGILSVHHEKERKKRDDDCLLSMVKAYLKRRHKGSSGSFVSPLHRLDAETSGVMVFALSNIGKKLELQFRNHTIKREYVALVSGRIEREAGSIKRALEKGRFRGGRKVRTSRDGEGKMAVTEYRVGERYENATLLNILVRTGRTHQIRVHFSSEGFPLIGDKLYDNSRKEDAKEVPLDFHRHALHARLLEFIHPRTEKKMHFRSPIPKDMKMLIDELRMAGSSQS